MPSFINGVKLKDADNNTERAILGFLEQEAKLVHYGKIIVEFSVTKGRLTKMDSIQERKSLMLDDKFNS